ncbi:hypothetical protein HHI36_015810 [Cryptolaemus montrouzieri]
MEKWNKGTDISAKESSTSTDGGGTEVAAIVVAPGEPVPPGFEGEMEKSTQIQERLDGFNVGPLVGLEYLLELLDYDPSKEPLYLCILCDKKGDPRTVLTHLSSYNHQVMYLQKHFPTVYRHIAPFMIKPFKRNWQTGLQRVVEAIENTFGRLKPMAVEASRFEKDRMHYIEIVAKGKHFNELSGHTFENVVTKEELTKIHEEPKAYDSTLPFRKNVQQVVPKRKSPSPPVVARPTKKTKPAPDNKGRKKSLSPVSDISSSDLEDFDPKNPPKSSVVSNNSKQTSARRARSPFGRRRDPSPKRREGPMPWQKSNYGRGKVALAMEKKRDEKSEKMEEYKKLCKAIDNDMEQVYKKHKLNPEKHPKYNDEWKKFWNSRYKELQAEGKNAATHDFKPEWIEFWNERMLDLHQEEVKNKKVALRKRLGLPEEPARICFKIGERRKPAESGSSKPLPTAAQPDNDPEVIVIEDNDKESLGSRSPSRSRKISRSPVRKRERSPQYRRRSPPGRRSPATRRSPNVRRGSSDRAKERLSPSLSSRISPSLKRDRDILRYSPPSGKYSIERSPGPDRFGRTRDRSKSRGRSREDSWERERHYDDKHWDRAYRSRAVPPWEAPPSWDHRYSPHIMNPYAPPKVPRDVTREPVRDQPEEMDEEEVNIVAVLRLLTALEERLGSLGPKVIDLLGQALAMEKKAANSSEELLDSEINCVLFETVKEKLKGQLLAGFVDRIQEKAFKNAIMKTASLIHLAGERKKQREVELPKKPVVVPGVGTVDKGKIARQIANALIAQGKTDVTQAELEQLINAVVGIAEAQKNSSQPITTASFLEKLAGGDNTEIKKEDTEAQSKPNSSLKVSECKEAVSKIEEEQETSTGSLDKSTINMEGLSDADLQTLLQNFKDLSTEEQHGLINYLKKLEAKEPERVEKLRKFVNLTENLEEKPDHGRYSPFSNRTGSVNPSSKDDAEAEASTEKKEEHTSTFVNIDSEEEEYTFEDVAKAASQKVIEKEMEQKRKEEETKRENEDKNLNDAKALITSLMSSLNKHNATNQVGSSNVIGSSNEAKPAATAKINIISNVPVSSADLAKSLSGITMSMSSLGSILGNVQNLTRQSQAAVGTITTPDANLVQEHQQKSNSLPSALGNLTADKPSPRNYNDFDIGSQKDFHSNPDLVAKDQGKNRPPDRSYDEFNIGPNPGELKGEKIDQRDLSRGPGFAPDRENRGPGFYNKSQGFPERNHPIGGLGFRNNPNQGGPSSYSNQNQFPSRPGASSLNKMGPLSRNFDIRESPRDFGSDRGEFGHEINESRSAMSDFRGEIRGGPSGDFRGSSEGDFRKNLGGDYRGNTGPDFRGNIGPDFRGSLMDDFKVSAGGEFRGNSDFRGNAGDFRGNPADFRDFRGGSGDFRGNSGSDYRGNSGDFRGDNRGGFRGGNEAMRISGGPSSARTGPPTKGGLLIDPNRLGNSAPPRYSGNFGGSSNFRRW